MLVSSQALRPGADRDDRIAVRDATGTVTYAQLRAAAAAMAHGSTEWARTEGQDGRFVALVGDWTHEFVAAFLGLSSAGWAVGVLDPTWSARETTAAIDQLDPAAIVTGCDRDHPVPSAGWVDRSSVREWRVLARRGPEGPTLARPEPDDPFYVGFTSGSSGRPKAFVRSHRSWWESFQGFALWSHEADGEVVIPGPLSSSHFLFGVLHALHVGATVDLTMAGSYTSRALDDRLTGGDVAAVYVVPTMLADLVDQGHPGVPGPAVIYCAGARLEPEVAQATCERFPGARLVEYYGASELSFVVIREHADHLPAGAAGRAFPGVEIAIRDEHDGVVDPGELGTIFVRSPLVFSGYRGAVPVSSARTTGDGWWTVGDRGRLDADGVLWVAGRGSSLIITGGANVQPEEVEGAIATLAGVTGCVVVGLPDPRWGEVVCAVVTVADGVEMRRADLRRHVAGLSRFKRPRRYVRIDGPLPMGRTGKVDRLAVRHLVEQLGPEEDLR